MNSFSLIMKKYEGFLGRVGWKEYALFFMFNFILNFVFLANTTLVNFFHSIGIGEWWGIHLIGAIYVLILLMSNLIWSIWRAYEFGCGLWLLDGLLKLLGAIGIIALMVILISIFNFIAPLLAESFYNYY